MVRIRGILVRILMRMRILGPVLLTNGSGCGSGSPKTYGSLESGSGILVHLHHSSKKKKIIIESENNSNQGFLTFFAWWWKNPDTDSYLWLTDPDMDPGGPNTCGSYGSGSATLDCGLINKLIKVLLIRLDRELRCLMPRILLSSSRYDQQCVLDSFWCSIC
jgi:hypothetical protein